jgi:hypothetical protein
MPEGFLAGFRREMAEAPAEIDGERVAIRLCEHLRAECERFNAPVNEIERWALNVELELDGPRFWTIECYGADAFHFYPAHVAGDGQIVWLNVWVRDDMMLGELIEEIARELGLRAEN